MDYISRNKKNQGFLNQFLTKTKVSKNKSLKKIIFSDILSYDNSILSIERK